MVREGIVIGHKIFNVGLEVDLTKIDVVSKLPPPLVVKPLRTSLGRVEFYRRFIKEFSQITKPLTNLFCADQPYNFNKRCIDLSVYPYHTKLVTTV